MEIDGNIYKLVYKIRIGGQNSDDGFEVHFLVGKIKEFVVQYFDTTNNKFDPLETAMSSVTDNVDKNKQCTND